MRLLLLATGGTIASKADPRGRLEPSLPAEELARWLPAKLRQHVEVADFALRGSGSMGPREMQQLSIEIARRVAREHYDGVVVTHGTDTMEETAYFLALTLPDGPPVVLTGAQKPASARDPDGPANLADAVRVALDPRSREYRVLVAFAGEVHEPRDVCKVHTLAERPFASGDAGPVGLVFGEQVKFRRPPRPLPRFAPEPMCPRVDIICAYAGADGHLAMAAVEAGSQGLVVQALGAGNVPEPLFVSLLEILDRGLPVVISSRVPFGPVQPIYGYAGGGATLLEAGAIFAGSLSAFKARLLLMLAVAQQGELSAVRQAFAMA